MDGIGILSWSLVVLPTSWTESQSPLDAAEKTLSLFHHILSTSQTESQAPFDSAEKFPDYCQSTSGVAVGSALMELVFYFVSLYTVDILDGVAGFIRRRGKFS